MSQKLKILELTNFSAGACGVWNRAFNESLELKKLGHQVKVFSSNAVKGSSEIAPEHEIKQGIEIQRFPFKKIGGESYMSWLGKEAEKEILNYSPDVIIAHSYRHQHTAAASRIAKKISAKCFLVTHAPFEDSGRSLAAKLYIHLFYDFFVGRPALKRFDKIIAISKWEIPYLEKLGVKKEKIEYIPNGIPNEFFLQKPLKEQNKVLFLGRISPIKNLECLIKAFSKLTLSHNSLILELVGPAEEEYLTKLKELVKNIGLDDKVIFSPAVYDLNEKIKKIDSAGIFVLPSKREAMPQALVEAMSRRKLIISSKTLGSLEIIEDKKTGFLFEVDDANTLSEIIDFSLNPKNKKYIKSIKNSAKKSSEKYAWKKLALELNKLISS